MSEKPSGEDCDEAIGYGRPPKQHQIQPKEIRNPYGRRGKPRPDTDFLDEPFDLGFDGKKIKTTRDRAVDFALFNAAMKGKVSAAKELKLRQRERAAMRADKGEAEVLSADDEAAFDRMIQRELRDRIASGRVQADHHTLASTNPASDEANQ